MKLLLNGIEYDVLKERPRITVVHYLDLEEESGIEGVADKLDTNGGLNWRVQLACLAFLIRRFHGEDVSWRQVASEVSEENIIHDPDDGEEPPDPTQPGSSSSESETSANT